jgi:DNA-binding CsgD family transcriptional regulator
MMNSNQEIILLSADGTVRRITAVARYWLALFFRVNGSEPLPDPIRGWLRAGCGNNLVIAKDQSSLEIQWLPCRRNGPEIVLLLQAAFPSPASGQDTGELTLRERDVLGWILKGKTNPEIGQILGTCPRTIDKHAERIYRKLGVSNRSEAIRLLSGGNGVSHHIPANGSSGERI